MHVKGLGHVVQACSRLPYCLRHTVRKWRQCFPFGEVLGVDGGRGRIGEGRHWREVLRVGGVNLVGVMSQ